MPRLGQTKPLIDRLMAKVEVQPSGCWHFTGSLNHQGYGKLHNRGAHRVFYEVFIGPIPSGLEIDHTCHKDTECAGGSTCQHRKCVNPNHLEPVTGEENRLRSKRNMYSEKQKQKTHCPQGHPYTEENSVYSGSNKHCRICKNEAVRRWHARNPEHAKALNKKSQNKNREKYLAQAKIRTDRWRNNNPERAAELARQRSKMYRQRKIATKQGLA